MIAPVVTVAALELRIAIRNRWVLISVALMTLFALALVFAGSAPTGVLGIDLLTVSVASLTTLTVYLAPLLALLLSFDGISGEAERGSLALLLTYPTSRGAILAGKCVAHVMILTLATCVGYGIAGIAATLAGGASKEGLAALVRLFWTTPLLGAAFLGIGYTLSGFSRQTSTAAALAIAAWLVFVVLYDLGILGALVFDDGGFFTSHVFPLLLIANPADAFRLVNMSGSEAAAFTSGMKSGIDAGSVWASFLSLILWPALSLYTAMVVFRRYQT